jgi:cytochrome c biogenesis protein CcdA
MDLGAWVYEIINTVNAPLLAAFLVGFLASIGPCPLVTNVVAVSYTARQFTDPRAVIATGFLYTLGRAMAYGLVGLVVLAAGGRVSRLASSLQDATDLGLGPMLILVGLVLLDVIRPSTDGGSAWLATVQEHVAQWRGIGAFLLGFTFALAFCPYSAVIFFGILMPLAFSSAGGFALPLVFGIGTGVPVLALGVPLALGVERAAAGLNRLSQVECAVRRLAALTFIGAGVYSTARYILTVAS